MVKTSISQEEQAILMTMPCQKSIDNYANYIDIENGDKYWISGLKKEECYRVLGRIWEEND